VRIVLDSSWRKEVEVEGLAPPLQLAIEMQSSLANGESIRSGIVRFASDSSSDTTDEFARVVRRFLIAWDQSQDWRSILKQVASPYRRSLLELAAHGLSGQSIQAPLAELQREIETACDEEIKLHIDMLPLKMLLPLLLLQFPAFMMVLFGPLLSRFVEEMSR
jgi:hypothetical protein